MQMVVNNKIRLKTNLSEKRYVCENNKTFFLKDRCKESTIIPLFKLIIVKLCNCVFG